MLALRFGSAIIFFLSVTVSYSIGGTAVNGIDYAACPGSVTIPAYESAATITVAPNPSLFPRPARARSP